MVHKPPAPILPLGEKFGPFHLERLIAVGGMAEVYQARAKGLAGFEKRLALKVIHAEFASDESFVRMLVQEAKTAVSLNHGNIVRTFDLGKIDDVYFISMEYVDGMDYFQLLRRLVGVGQKVPVNCAMYVARELAAGLAHAHSRTDEKGEPLEIIHRDISPQNILVSSEGEVKIADFGVAKVANASGRTKAGVIKGKIVYMSPEQSWGEQLDQRSDIFSAGIVLYESLAGSPMYADSNAVALLHQVRNAVITPPSTQRPELEQEADELVMKALARDPKERYQTAREFETALSEYLREFAPSFKRRDLAAVVKTAFDAEKASAGGGRGRKSRAASVEPMGPDDFPVVGHSVVVHSVPDATEALDSSQSDSQGSYGSEVAVATITLMEGDKEQSYEVGERFTIGRGGELRLADGRVSRRHARIVYADSKYVIEDLNSSNGSFVNRERVQGPQALNSGDVIHIGPYEMKFFVQPTGATTRDARRGVAQKPSEEQSTAGLVKRTQASEVSPETSAAVLPSSLGLEEVSAVGETAGLSAYLALRLGDDLMRVPLQDGFALGHVLEANGTKVEGAGGTIVLRGGSYRLEPTDGRGGITVNGRPVTKGQPLASGDEIKVGSVRAKFQVGDDD